jgi:hypothetical protein
LLNSRPPSDQQRDELVTVLDVIVSWRQDCGGQKSPAETIGGVFDEAFLKDHSRDQFTLVEKLQAERLAYSIEWLPLSMNAAKQVAKGLSSDR